MGGPSLLELAREPTTFEPTFHAVHAIYTIIALVLWWQLRKG